MTKAARNEAVSNRSASEESKGRGRDGARKSEEASDGIKRFRTVILLVLAFVIGVVLLFTLVSSLRQRRTEELAARFYTVFTEPVENGEEPDLAAVEAVIADARGRAQEQWFLRVTVEHLLTAADEEDAEKRRAASAAATLPDADTSNPDDAGSTLTAEAARAKARSLVEAARDRLDSPAVSEWAASVLARLEGLKSDSWRPPPRTYQVLPPPSMPTSETDPSQGSSSQGSSTANEEQQSADTSAGSETPDGSQATTDGDGNGAEEE